MYRLPILKHGKQTDIIFNQFLPSNHCFQLKYNSSIHNIAFCSSKLVLSEPAEKYCMHRSSTAYKQERKKSSNMIVDFDVRGQQRMDFFTVWSIIMDYELIFWPEAMVKTLILMATIHFRWSIGDVMLNFLKTVEETDEETNSFRSWMAWGWVFIFGWTIPLIINVNNHNHSNHQVI